MSVTVSETEYVAALENTCVGFFSELVALPSAKFHNQLTTEPSLSVELSVNVTVAPTVGLGGKKLNKAVGAKLLTPEDTVTECEIEPVRLSLSVRVNETVYVPPALYVCEVVEPVPVLPSPKVHA